LDISKINSNINQGGVVAVIIW